MNRFQHRQKQLNDEQRCGLVTYLTAGDPDPATSLECLLALAEKGADLIELGMPFSDPMADGPAIQTSHRRALDGGQTLQRTLQLVADFRSANQPAAARDIPLILMGYANPIWQYGVEAFCRDAARAGVDGLLVVDVPIESDQHWREACAEQGLIWPRMVAPTTLPDRLSEIEQRASGFLYVVSHNGITGVAQPDGDAVKERVHHLRQHCRLPLALGFGLRQAEQLRQYRDDVEWLVVGSALVETLGDHAPEQVSKSLAAQVALLRQALDC